MAVFLKTAKSKLIEIRTGMLVQEGFEFSNQAKVVDQGARNKLLALAEKRYRKALQLDPGHIQASGNLSGLLTDAIGDKFDSNSRPRFEEPERLARIAAQDQKDLVGALNLGLVLFKRSLIEPPDVARSLLDEAIENYQRSVHLEPKRTATYLSLAQSAHFRAARTTGSEKRTYLQLAVEMGRIALQLDRSQRAPMSHLANSLFNLSFEVPRPVSVQLLSEAEAWSRLALQIDPSHIGTKSDLIRILWRRAAHCSVEVAQQKFVEILWWIEDVLRERPDRATTLYNRVSALYIKRRIADRIEAPDAQNGLTQAIQTALSNFRNYVTRYKDDPGGYQMLGMTCLIGAVGSPKSSLWDEAELAYEKATALMPEDDLTLHQWGDLYLARAFELPNPEKHALLVKAKELFGKLDSLYPGRGKYPLACVAAAEDNEMACQQLLEECFLSDRAPTQLDFALNRDLDIYRDRPWFIETVDRVFPK